MDYQGLNQLFDNLNKSIPEVNLISILTVDGLPILSSQQEDDNTDSLSALTALMCNCADRIAGCFEPAGLNGAVVSFNDQNYTVIKLSNDYALGIKTPTSIEHAWLMQRVRQLVQTTPATFN